VRQQPPSVGRDGWNARVLSVLTRPSAARVELKVKERERAVNIGVLDGIQSPGSPGSGSGGVPLGGKMQVQCPELTLLLFLLLPPRDERDAAEKAQASKQINQLPA